MSACSPSAPAKTDIDPPAMASQTVSATAPTTASAAPSASVFAAATPKPLSSVLKPADRMAEAVTALDARVVDDSHIGRRFLVTWTPRHQADPIAQGGPVLTLIESKVYGPSGFDFMLDDEVARGNKLARLLFNSGFAKKRFAWPNGYATATGNNGGRYGPVMMLIELKPDALILDFAREKVFDIQNREVPLADLTARPERLGAVYWQTVGYREYVLVNEAAIFRASSGSDEALALFEAEKATLAQLTGAMRQLLIGDEKPILDKFAKTLAFATTATREAIDTIETFAKTNPPDKFSFVVEPKHKFNLGVSRGRLRPGACKLQGSTGRHRGNWDGSYGGGQYCVPGERCQNVSGKCQTIRRPLFMSDALGN